MVVAPISCNSPLASKGFNIFDASTAPSAPPAPMIVWSSSRKSNTFPALTTSFITFLILSSNSPRYFEPAIIAGRSRVTSLLSSNVSGTSFEIIREASPSTTAVFPTPGSPISTGLFLVLLDKICITLLVSLSLPITGSSLPILANSVKSLEYLSSVGVDKEADLLLVFS